MFLVYTDGSCSAKDRVGGYAYKVVDKEFEYLGGGSEVDTTISRMELMACIAALKYLLDQRQRAVILLFSDSEYVVKGFTDKTRNRTKNVDLWLELEELAGKHIAVVMEHCRGHADTPDNHDVDKLAGEFRQAALHG